jgi:hypothetical protein
MRLAQYPWLMGFKWKNHWQLFYDTLILYCVYDIIVSVLIRSLFQTRPSIEWQNLLSLSQYISYSEQKNCISIGPRKYSLSLHQYWQISSSECYYHSQFTIGLLILDTFMIQFLLLAHRYPLPLRVNMASLQIYPVDKSQQSI